MDCPVPRQQVKRSNLMDTLLRETEGMDLSVAKKAREQTRENIAKSKQTMLAVVKRRTSSANNTVSSSPNNGFATNQRVASAASGGATPSSPATVAMANSPQPLYRPSIVSIKHRGEGSNESTPQQQPHRTGRLHFSGKRSTSRPPSAVVIIDDDENDYEKKRDTRRRQLQQPHRPLHTTSNDNNDSNHHGIDPTRDPDAEAFASRFENEPTSAANNNVTQPATASVKMNDNKNLNKNDNKWNTVQRSGNEATNSPFFGMGTEQLLPDETADQDIGEGETTPVDKKIFRQSSSKTFSHSDSATFSTSFQRGKSVSEMKRPSIDSQFPPSGYNANDVSTATSTHSGTTAAEDFVDDISHIVHANHQNNNDTYHHNQSAANTSTSQPEDNGGSSSASLFASAAATNNITGAEQRQLQLYNSSSFGDQQQLNQQHRLRPIISRQANITAYALGLDADNTNETLSSLLPFRPTEANLPPHLERKLPLSGPLFVSDLVKKVYECKRMSSPHKTARFAKSVTFDQLVQNGIIRGGAGSPSASTPSDTTKGGNHTVGGNNKNNGRAGSNENISNNRANGASPLPTNSGGNIENGVASGGISLFLSHHQHLYNQPQTDFDSPRSEASNTRPGTAASHNHHNESATFFESSAYNLTSNSSSNAVDTSALFQTTNKNDTSASSQPRKWSGVNGNNIAGQNSTSRGVLMMLNNATRINHISNGANNQRRATSAMALVEHNQQLMMLQNRGGQQQPLSASTALVPFNSSASSPPPPLFRSYTPLPLTTDPILHDLLDKPNRPTARMNAVKIATESSWSMSPQNKHTIRTVLMDGSVRLGAAPIRKQGNINFSTLGKTSQKQMLQNLSANSKIVDGDDEDNGKNNATASTTLSAIREREQKEAEEKEEESKREREEEDLSMGREGGGGSNAATDISTENNTDEGGTVNDSRRKSIVSKKNDSNRPLKPFEVASFDRRFNTACNKINSDIQRILNERSAASGKLEAAIYVVTRLLRPIYGKEGKRRKELNNKTFLMSYRLHLRALLRWSIGRVIISLRERGVQNIKSAKLHLENLRQQKKKKEEQEHYQARVKGSTLLLEEVVDVMKSTKLQLKARELLLTSDYYVKLRKRFEYLCGTERMVLSLFELQEMASGSGTDFDVKLFRKIDLDRGGYLEFDEIVHSFFPTIPLKILRNMMRRFDDENGLQSTWRKKIVAENAKAALIASNQRKNSSSNGSDDKDAVNAMSQLQLTAESKEQVSLLFRATDRDGKGYVTRSDMIRQFILPMDHPSNASISGGGGGGHNGGISSNASAERSNSLSPTRQQQQPYRNHSISIEERRMSAAFSQSNSNGPFWFDNKFPTPDAFVGLDVFTEMVKFAFPPFKNMFAAPTKWVYKPPPQSTLPNEIVELQRRLAVKPGYVK